MREPWIFLLSNEKITPNQEKIVYTFFKIKTYSSNLKKSLIMTSKEIVTWSKSINVVYLELTLQDINGTSG